MLSQKGFSSLILLILGVLALSGGIIGGSLLYKQHLTTVSSKKNDTTFFPASPTIVPLTTPFKSTESNQVPTQSSQAPSNKTNGTSDITFPPPSGIPGGWLSYTSKIDKLRGYYPPDWMIKIELNKATNYESINIISNQDKTDLINIYPSVEKGQHPSDPWTPSVYPTLDGISCSEEIKSINIEGNTRKEYECIKGGINYGINIFSAKNNLDPIFDQIVQTIQYAK